MVMGMSAAVLGSDSLKGVIGVSAAVLGSDSLRG